MTSGGGTLKSSSNRCFLPSVAEAGLDDPRHLVQEPVEIDTEEQLHAVRYHGITALIRLTDHTN